MPELLDIFVKTETLKTIVAGVEFVFVTSSFAENNFKIYIVSIYDTVLVRGVRWTLI